MNKIKVNKNLQHMMWLGLEVEMLNQFELFGFSVGVTVMIEDNDEKKLLKK